MQGKTKTIALIALLVVLGAVAAYMYWPEKVESGPPAPVIEGDSAPGAPARPGANPEEPPEPPAGREEPMMG